MPLWDGMVMRSNVVEVAIYHVHFGTGEGRQLNKPCTDPAIWVR
jgi:hypothetical protein